MNPTDRPRRFARPTLLIVGCGDVGLRVAGLLRGRWRLLALTSTPGRREALRAAGVVPLAGDLDRPETLARLAGLADAVLHLAPPAATRRRGPAHRPADRRRWPARRACAAWSTARPAASTAIAAASGSTRPGRSRPATDRARRRVDAEARLRALRPRAPASP